MTEPLYKTDFYGWTQQQAQLIRVRQPGGSGLGQYS